VLDAPDADLALLGLDSLELTELIVDLETSLAFEFPADLLDPATFRTVRSIASAVEASRG
jgi:acyl carrier protein